MSALDSPSRTFAGDIFQSITTDDVQMATSKNKFRLEPLPDLFANDDIPLEITDSDLDGEDWVDMTTWTTTPSFATLVMDGTA